MNALLKPLKKNYLYVVLITLVIIIYLFYILYFRNEGWVPWVWNIPTRDIYPPLYYDYRCAPPVQHFYKYPQVSCATHSQFAQPIQLAPLEYGLNTVYLYSDYPAMGNRPCNIPFTYL